MTHTHTVDRVRAVIAGSPGLRSDEIAARAGTTRTRVQKLVRILQVSGDVETMEPINPGGRGWGWRVTPFEERP